ncbi:hypothetical protein V6N13_093137 [Hibiscus sabdariffa]
MVTADGNWKWEAFRNVLPSHVLLHVAAISPPIPSFLNASIAWTGEASGKFSVRSAYQLCSGEISGEEDPMWKAVNRYAVREWILENLRSPEKFVTAANWELLFGAVLWNIWLARNAVVFNSPSCFPNPIIQSSRLLVERTLQAYSAVRGSVRSVRTASATTQWTPPEEGWLKLNTDGAKRNQDGSLMCGGVLRDHTGSWHFGFSKYIGFCEVFEAELWGVWCGLQLAWEKGCRRIILEVDSLDVVKALKEDRRQGHVCTLLLHIRLLIQRNLAVQVVHVLRSANSVADRLAKLATPGSNCVTYFANPPPSIEPILQGDIASHSVSHDSLCAS